MKSGKLIIALVAGIILIVPSILIPIFLLNKDKPTDANDITQVSAGTYSLDRVRLNTPAGGSQTIGKIKDLDLIALLQHEIIAMAPEILPALMPLLQDLELAFTMEEDGPELSMPVGSILVPLLNFLMSDEMYDPDGPFYKGGVALTGEDRVRELMRVVMMDAFDGNFAFAASILDLMLAIERAGALFFGVQINSHLVAPAILHIWGEEQPEAQKFVMDTIKWFGSGPLAAWDLRDSADPETPRNLFVASMNNNMVTIEREDGEITNLQQIESLFPQLDTTTIPATLDRIFNLAEIEKELLNKNAWFTYFVWDNPGLTSGNAANTLSFHPAYAQYRSWLAGNASFPNQFAQAIPQRVFTQTHIDNLINPANGNSYIRSGHFVGPWAPTGFGVSAAARLGNARAISAGKAPNNALSMPTVSAFAQRFGLTITTSYQDTIIAMGKGKSLDLYSLNLLVNGSFPDPTWTGNMFQTPMIPMFDALYFILMEAFSAILFPNEIPAEDETPAISPKEQLVSMIDTILEAGVGAKLDLVNLLPLVLEFAGADGLMGLVSELLGDSFDIEEILGIVDSVLGGFDSLAFNFNATNNNLRINGLADFIGGMVGNLLGSNEELQGAIALALPLILNGLTYNLSKFEGRHIIEPMFAGAGQSAVPLLEHKMITDLLAMFGDENILETIAEFLHVAIIYDHNAGEVILKLEVSVNQSIEIAEGVSIPLDLGLEMEFIFKAA